MVKLKIHVNKKTGQRIIFLPKKCNEFNVKDSKFIDLEKVKMIR